MTRSHDGPECEKLSDNDESQLNPPDPLATVCVRKFCATHFKSLFSCRTNLARKCDRNARARVCSDRTHSTKSLSVPPPRARDDDDRVEIQFAALVPLAAGATVEESALPQGEYLSIQAEHVPFDWVVEFFRQYGSLPDEIQ